MKIKLKKIGAGKAVFLVLALVTALAAVCPGSSPAEVIPVEERVLQVWRLFDEGDLEKALDLAGDIHDAEGVSLLVLTSLVGFIHEEQGRYDEALSRLESVKATFRELLFPPGGGEGLPESLRSSYLRLYLGVLRAAGFAHFRTGNCPEAVPELQELMRILGAPNPLAISMVGACMYGAGDYDSALIAFEETYKWYGEGPLKDEAAYNVAAMHALLGSVEKSVQWLTTASARDRRRWVEAAAADGDFDGIRESEAFVEFMEGKVTP